MAAGRLIRAFLVISAAWLVAACDESRGLKLFETAEYPERRKPPSELLRPPAALKEPAPMPQRAAVEAAPRPAPKPAPEVYSGSGDFVDRDAAASRPVRVSPRGDITFSFVDANIREVVRSILGDTLEANYGIDPKVQGNVTVQTSRPLRREALVGALENILRLVDAALVQSNGFYSIVPVAKAARGGPRPTVGQRRGTRVKGFGVHIVPLSFVAAAEMAKILEPVAPKGGILRVDQARNLLVLSGTERELASLLEMVDIFDVDWLKAMSFALFPLEAAEAKELIGELEPIFGDKAEGPLAGLVRLVPIERTNTVLVISPRRAYIDEVGTWIRRLDRGGEGIEQRLYVYYVQNGRAENLATILRDIFALSQPSAAERVQLAPGRTPVEIGSRMRRGEAGAAPRGETSSARRVVEGQRAVGTGRLAQATRTEERAGTPRAEGRAYAARAQAARGAGTAAAPQVTSELRIIADDANNALVIMATPQEYRQIEAALKKLDIVPLQVLIEATIAEVVLTDELRYGVQWFFQAGNSSISLGTSAAAVGRAAVVQASPGFSYLFNSPDIRVVLNALEGVTDVNVISSPQLMVLDNQTAELQVGDQVPIPIQSAVSVTDPDSPIVNSVEFRDTGVILRVTPRVNAGGLVIMEIDQEVSDVVATTTSGIDAPTIQQRRIQTTVAVQSGETVALGGLIRDNREVGKTGVPLLQDIPILGLLFRNTENIVKRTELLVLITPRVVRNRDEARDVTEELRRRLRTLVPLEKKVE